MADIFQKLAFYLEFPFVRYALIVGVLISLCSSLLGVTLVLKRFSFIGTGLSHVAFGAMSVAAVAGLTNDMTLVLPVTIICALALLGAGHKMKVNGDAAVAMMSVSALALGYLVMNIFPVKSGNVSADVCTTLFGSTSILTLSPTEVWLSAALSLVVIAVFILGYNKIFSITFDESFARATGVKVRLYHVVFATVIAVVIVLAMNLVGSLLISALVVFPVIAAMRVCRTFKGVTLCAAAISLTCSLLGILTAIVAGTPVGSTIVVIDLVAFVIFFAIGKLKRGITA